MSERTNSAQRVGLVHTVPSLAGHFHDLLNARAPQVEALHIVDPTLLTMAISRGLSEDLCGKVVAHVDHLAACGADAVLVTCSSIGEAAEFAAEHARVPVFRVDSPMADAAAVIATAPGAHGRIAVLATLEATLGPTGRLVGRALGDAAAEVEIRTILVRGAADARAASDTQTHDRLVSEAVLAIAGTVDVVLLAQASMALAFEACSVAIPVLTSPITGAAALLDAMARSRAVRPT